MNWSYSKLQCYLNCPKQFEYQYIVGRKFKPNENLLIGAAVHRFLEFYGKNPNTDLASCEREYKKSCKNVAPEVINKYLPLIKKYFDSKKILDVKFVEKRFSLFFAGIKFTGVIDVVTKDDRICDYKTAAKPYSLARVQESLQLTFYAAWFYRFYGRLPFRVGYQVILKDGSGVQELWDTRTFTQIKNAKKIIMDCNTEIQNTKTFKKVKILCKWCNFENECE